VYAVNGWQDHVHMVVSIPPNRAVSEVVKHLKGASSHDQNHGGGLDHQFGWQRGSGVMTFGEGQKATAEAYVVNQKRHHEQQATNAWLEHYTEFDEGPSDLGIRPSGVPSVREEMAIYETRGTPPF
jgi:putative transposase